MGPWVGVGRWVVGSVGWRVSAGGRGGEDGGWVAGGDGEEEGFKLMGNGVSVPAPDLLVCLLLICAPSIPVAGCDGGSGMPADFIERPRGWVSTWQFVQRAALSPRAPTLSLA